MSDLISQLFTLPVRIMLIITAIILVLLWIVSIVWVNRDARARNAAAGLWTLIAIVPIAGAVAYCLLRPPLSATDNAEQAMNLELMSRQLSDYGNCPKCGEPVKQDYIACPHCCTQLRNVCPSCGRPLEPGWQLCPYCAHPAGNRPQRQRTRQ